MNIVADWLDHEDGEVTFNRAQEEHSFIDKLCCKIGVDSRPYILLIYDIIKNAALEGDVAYFTRSTGERHCELLGLSSRDILDGIKERRAGTPKGPMTRKKHGAYVRSQRDEILAKVEKGCTRASLVREYGVSKEFLLKLLGPAAKNSPGEIEIQRFISDRLAGMSKKRIAEKHKRSVATVSRILEERLPGHTTAKKKSKFCPYGG